MAPLKSRRKQRYVTGLPPGTLLSHPAAEVTRLDVIAYGPTEISEVSIQSVSELVPLIQKFPVTWLNVSGLKNVDVIQEVGKYFGLHPLALEDAVNVHQRAKADVFQDFEFIVVRMVNPPPLLATEQLSIFLGKRFVVTFQEEPGDCFGAIRDRLRKGQGQLRQSGPDYLTYQLLDAVVDSYFPILERYGDRLDELEEASLSRSRASNVRELHAIKRELFHIRRAAWPMRDMLASLVRDTSPLIGPDARLHLRDCFDHTMQVIDLLEVSRELSSDLIELYLAMINTRMNEVMRVLTVIATIFIPITFIASVYGMNFKHMPELDWPYGYAWALGLMAGVAAAFLIFFGRKGWLHSFMPQNLTRKTEGDHLP